jgi:drug/metabolite transporter (DMT)-like permease
MPRFYVLLGCLTAGSLALTLTARTHHHTAATVGWAFATVLGVVLLVGPLVIMFLMRRVRPASRRGRHAER